MRIHQGPLPQFRLMVVALALAVLAILVGKAASGQELVAPRPPLQMEQEMAHQEQVSAMQQQISALLAQISQLQDVGDARSHTKVLRAMLDVFTPKVTINKGDTLLGLHKKHAQTGEKYGEWMKSILALNPTIVNPNRIYAGAVLVLPPVPLDVEKQKEMETEIRDLQSQLSLAQSNTQTLYNENGTLQGRATTLETDLSVLEIRANNQRSSLVALTVISGVLFLVLIVGMSYVRGLHRRIRTLSASLEGTSQLEEDMEELRRRFIKFELRDFIDVLDPSDPRKEILFPIVRKGGRQVVILDCGHGVPAATVAIYKHMKGCDEAQQQHGLKLSTVPSPSDPIDLRFSGSGGEEVPDNTMGGAAVAPV